MTTHHRTGAIRHGPRAVMGNQDQDGWTFGTDNPLLAPIAATIKQYTCNGSANQQWTRWDV